MQPETYGSQCVLLGYGTDEEAKRAAVFIAELVRQCVTFKVCQPTDNDIRITFTGGY